MRLIVPIRLGIIKRYFDKYKYQKKKRDEIIAALEESEEQIREVLGDKEYVHYSEAIPEIGQFLNEVREKEARLLEEKQKKEGTKIAEFVDLKSFV
jgi:ribosome-binding factor A